jgi:hypothetical protein
VAAIALVTLQRLPQGAHRRAQVSDLLEMRLRELIQLLGPERCQGDADDAFAGGVGIASHQALGHGTVDQSHGAVVAKHQVVGYFADRRTVRIGVTLDRQ